MKKPPAFQFYAKDFLVGTMEMSLTEIGAYAKLLAWSWDNGPLPADEGRRAKVLGVSVRSARIIWSGIQDKWVPSDAGFTNTRLEKQRHELETFRENRSEQGREGGIARWASDPKGPRHAKTRSQRLSEARSRGTHTGDEWLEMLRVYQYRCVRCGCETLGNPCKDHVIPIYQGGDDSIQNIQPLCRGCNSGKGADRTDYRASRPETLPKWLAQPGISKAANVMQTPTSSSSVSDLHTATADQDREDLFADFWRAYPKKVGKGEAEKQFGKLHVTQALLASMLSALDWQIRTPQWARDGGKFIPHPSTWLHQHRWEDEPFQPDTVDPNEAAWADIHARIEAKK